MDFETGDGSMSGLAGSMITFEVSMSVQTLPMITQANPMIIFIKMKGFYCRMSK